MRSHKYVKRTGSKGNYKYWYKLPDGRIVEGDQAKGRVEHVNRLVAARSAGHHAMTNAEIAQHTGHTVANGVNSRVQAMAGRVRRGKAAHDFSEHHMKESKHHDVDSSEYTEKIARHHGEVPVGSGPPTARDALRARMAPDGGEAIQRPRRRRAATPRPTSDLREASLGFSLPPDPAPARSPLAYSGGAADAATATRQEHTIAARTALEGMSLGDESDSAADVDGDGAVSRSFRTRQYFTDRPGEEDDDDPDFTGQAEALRDVKSRLSREILSVYDLQVQNAGEKGWINVTLQPKPGGAAERPASAVTGPRRRTPQIAAPAGSAPLGIPKRPAKTAEATASAARVRELRARLSSEHGVNLTPDEESEAAQARPAARATAERVRAAKASLASPASPTAAHAAPLHEADPAFAASEAPIREMLEVQARGGNPYLDRAKTIFNRIKGDLKPERKKAVEHLLAAMAAVGTSDQPALLAKYKELTGSTRIRTLPKDEFEKATFITLDEVTGNPPINVEMERMKRGYGAKQFARMKPFFKESFTRQYPSAPPPYPTFGDIKSWTEHAASGGGAKPEWAGSTRLALPKDVHTASVKGPDGKPLYPPAWMPIQLMPVWNYVAKSEGAAAYQTTTPTFVGGKVRAGSQASFQEGMIKSALRKYVEHRGGEDQLVDIPSLKLAEKGTSHEEIFKADDGEAKMLAMLKTKIVDPVALMPFIQAEQKGGKAKKSFSLVVDENLPAMDFKKSFTIKLSKAEAIIARIEKVKGLINEKKSRS